MLLLSSHLCTDANTVFSLVYRCYYTFLTSLRSVAIALVFTSVLMLLLCSYYGTDASAAFEKVNNAIALFSLVV